MKVSITQKGVFVDGQEIKNVVSADAVNLQPDGPAKVVLCISTDEVEVDHKWLGHGTN